MSLASQFFSWLSFRGIVAFATFFGLAGLAGNASNLTWQAHLPLGIMVGIIAMIGITALMRLFNKAGASGTANIQNTVGQPGQVYIPIAANQSGVGKVTVTFQGRTMEFEAQTTHSETLKTGDPIVVVSVINPSTLLVAPAGSVGGTQKPF